MEDENFFMSFLKEFMKPGYIYFKGNDGEIYQAKICNDLNVAAPIFIPPLVPGEKDI